MKYHETRTFHILKETYINIPAFLLSLVLLAEHYTLYITCTKTIPNMSVFCICYSIVLLSHPVNHIGFKLTIEQ